MSEHKETSILARFASPLIVLATIIWGSSFVVMKNSVDVLPTYWLLAIRFSFAALVLAIVFIKRWKVLDRQYLIGGTVMGFCLFVAYAFQTFGLEQTTSGKNAFFTAVYCVIVPFLAWAVLRTRPDRYNIAAALLCVTGVGLVSLNEALSVNAAALFAISFYSRLSAVDDIHTAFTEAVGTVKASYPEPYYWAAFILVD